MPGSGRVRRGWPTVVWEELCGADGQLEVTGGSCSDAVLEAVQNGAGSWGCGVGQRTFLGHCQGEEQKEGRVMASRECHNFLDFGGSDSTFVG